VEEDHAVQFGSFHHSPTSALNRFHLVVAIPSPFDGKLAFPCRQAAIHKALDVADVKLTTALLVELDERLNFLMKVFFSFSSGLRCLGRV
jgi:hypothetical protein